MTKKENKNLNNETLVNSFLTNCSIRGVSKAHKTNSFVIKSIWIIFIILMMMLLSYSVIKIILEYLEFNTTIQTKLQLEDASPFPSITICPYQPFSERAIKFFNNSGMSPKDFSWKLRQTAKGFLENNAAYKAEAILFYDDLRVYYQNINYKSAIEIGLDDVEIFAFCITKVKYGILFGEVRSNCGYNISRYSSPDFFNCYTINVRPEYSLNTEYIHLILRFPKPETLDRFRETSLLKTLSQNIIGAQLLIHERGSSPTSTNEKFHIEPNRLLQINYKNIKWKEYNTPTDICLSNSETLEKIVDLENEYSFSFQGCLDTYKARMILKKCKCVMANLPRLIIPTAEYPYCANFQNITEDGINHFWKTSLCISNVLINEKKLSRSYKNCFKKCEEQKFDFQMSNIKWHPSIWQLEWLFKLQKSWNILIENPSNSTDTSKAKDIALQFLNAKEMADLTDEHESPLMHKAEDYACIVLERLSNGSYYKEERLGISLFGLVSRVGGSCTLYLGLTCAFIIEVIELLVLLWRKTSFRTYCHKSENIEVNQMILSNTTDSHKENSSSPE